MKKILLLFAVSLMLSCCNKDDDVNNANIALPPATQTGAGTFACKVNGQNFIDTSGGFFNCFYQNVNGEYFFGIGATDLSHQGTSLPWSLNLSTFNRTIENGEILQLLEPVDGNAFGEGFFSNSSTSGVDSFTNMDNTGELTITKLDYENNILSGIFWYNIENPNTGEIVEIREGRFDTLFTQ